MPFWFVAAFVSKSYVEGDITMNEASAAIIRENDEKRNCLIPIYMDDAKLPKLDPDINYIPVKYICQRYADTFFKKVLLSHTNIPGISTHLTAWRYSYIILPGIIQKPYCQGTSNHHLSVPLTVRSLLKVNIPPFRKRRRSLSFYSAIL